MRVSSRPCPSTAAVPPPHSASHPHQSAPLRVGCSHRRSRPVPCPSFHSFPCLTGPSHHVGYHSRGGPHCCRGPYCHRAEHDRRHGLLKHEAHRYRRVEFMSLICSTRYIETRDTKLWYSLLPRPDRSPRLRSRSRSPLLAELGRYAASSSRPSVGIGTT